MKSLTISKHHNYIFHIFGNSRPELLRTVMTVEKHAVLLLWETLRVLIDDVDNDKHDV